MPGKNLSDAIFELKDKKRSSKPSPAPKIRRPAPLPFSKRRSFDTFYLFSVALLLLAIVVQIVAITIYS